MSCERGYYQSTTEQTRVFNGQGVSERFPMCKPCPTAFYEDRVGSTGCIPCPEYYRTNSTGAKSVKECFGKLFYISIGCASALAGLVYCLQFENAQICCLQDLSKS